MMVSRLTTPEARTSAYYFTFFMGAGAATAYLPIWLVSEGLSGDQLGYISAVPIFIMMGLNLFVGRLADRLPDWRSTIVVATVISGLAPIGLFGASGFWWILAVFTLTNVPLLAATPVADAAAIRMTRRRGSDYGFVRAWGTVGFMVFNALMGASAALWGTMAFVPVFVLAGLLRAVAALGLPHFRADDEPPAGPAVVVPGAAEAVPDPASVAPLRPRARLSEALKPWFVITLIGAALLFACHLVLMSYLALIWKDTGIPVAVIGPLIAMGALAEAAMMFAFRRFASRFSARHLILFASCVMAARMALMSLEPSVPLLFALQSLHAITFALGFLGTVNFIANWTSEDIAAEAQSFYVVLQQAVCGTAIVGFGYLIGPFGVHSLLAISTLAVLAALCILVSLRLKTTRGGGAQEASSASR